MSKKKKKKIKRGNSPPPPPPLCFGDCKCNNLACSSQSWKKNICCILLHITTHSLTAPKTHALPHPYISFQFSSSSSPPTPTLALLYIPPLSSLTSATSLTTHKMITLLDFYHVMTAMVPLYVAMILAYGSVKWWKIFSPDQCSGINRFVALFAVPLLSFHFIASNNPYKMNLRFLAADTLQKIIILVLLAVWSNFTKRGCLEWTITLFSLSTLPNTLVMGIPLLKGMYGEFSGSLMVQIVVLQCIIWYTLMLFMFEFRGARMLISEQFPDTAGSIVSIHVDSDVMSLDGRQPLETEAEIKEDGKLHVTVRKSNASRSDIFSRRSQGLSSTTPRPSNLTNAEIYSLQSSRNPTPRGSSFNHTDFYSMMAAGGRNSNFGASDVYGLSASRGPTPRPSNYDEDGGKPKFHYHAGGTGHYPAPNPGMFSPSNGSKSVAAANANANAKKPNGQAQLKPEDGNRDLHMFVWSSSASPVSDVFGGHEYGGHDQKEVKLNVSPGKGLFFFIPSWIYKS